MHIYQVFMSDCVNLCFYFQSVGSMVVETVGLVFAQPASNTGIIDNYHK